METFDEIKMTLEALEREHFNQLNHEFAAPHEANRCITGAVRFFALHQGKHTVTTDPLPVVCTVGINYTQEDKLFDGQLHPYVRNKNASVVHNTNCMNATSLAIAAYNRNASVWTERRANSPASPLDFYAAKNATGRARIFSGDAAEIKDAFILIMTNISPFITRSSWQVQAKRTEGTCREISSDTSHLDSLYATLGQRIDLWIGHSAIDGTKWVWPAFCDFLQKHHIAEWMLTGNISSVAPANFNGHFKRPDNKLYPWFAPAPQSAAYGAYEFVEGR